MASKPYLFKAVGLKKSEKKVLRELKITRGEREGLGRMLTNAELLRYLLIKLPASQYIQADL